MESTPHSAFAGASHRRIDSHHHLWHYTPQDYAWIEDNMAALRRDFLIEDLVPLLEAARVSGTVAVHASQNIEETSWLLSLAEQSPAILGVVGWLPIAAESFPQLLEQHAASRWLKGLRHVVQAEALGFLDGTAFLRGMEHLKTHDLVYDILIFARQLEETLRFVDRFPSQQFVLDHIAKPDIRGNGFDAWAGPLRALAQRDNVCCKLSGMVTEADPKHWTATQLKPYFDTVLQAFGPQRLMVGTDWPVCTLGCGYVQWWQIVEEWIAPLSSTEQAAVLAGTATRTYRLTEQA